MPMTPRGPVVKPKPSATLVLLREGAGMAEVLLLRRPPAQAFGNAFVFPGGCVESQDQALAALCEGVDDAQASARLGVTGGGLVFWAAAIRECFEESGVLLARNRDDQLLSFAGAQEAARYADYRQLIREGRMRLLDVCREEGLRLAADRLEYFSFWITPVQAPQRFSTRFFAAAAPPMQPATHDGVETLEACWMSPEEALQRAGTGFEIRPPTRGVLAKFTAARSVAEGLARARAAAVDALSPVRPVMVRRGGRVHILLPGEPGYAQALAEVPDE